MRFKQEKEVAVFAVREAGKIVIKLFRKKQKRSYKEGADFATESDIKAEKKIISIIQKKFPTHSIITEESEGVATNSDYTWYIDPIDGTVNYGHGMAYFCIVIALTYKDEAVMSVIYDPLHDELFTAEKGRGAYMNGRRIHVSDEKNLKRGYVLIGLSSYKVMNVLRKEVVHGVRMLGCSGIGFASVACGRADARIKLHSGHPWDYVGGCLLVEEAGGMVSDADGHPWSVNSKQIIATNKKIHKKLLSIIKGLVR